MLRDNIIFKIIISLGSILLQSFYSRIIIKLQRQIIPTYNVFLRDYLRLRKASISIDLQRQTILTRSVSLRDYLRLYKASIPIGLQRQTIFTRNVFLRNYLYLRRASITISYRVTALNYSYIQKTIAIFYKLQS